MTTGNLSMRAWADWRALARECGSASVIASPVLKVECADEAVDDRLGDVRARETITEPIVEATVTALWSTPQPALDVQRRLGRRFPVLAEAPRVPGRVE
jgi:hypothetical protein